MNVSISKVWNGNAVKIQGRKVVGKSIYETGLIVESQAKSLCPVDTGQLSASITTKSIDRASVPGPEAKPEDIIKAPTDPNEVLVGTALEHGVYQEFGTIKMDAQPFLRPALDLAKGKVLTVLEKNGRFEFAEYLQ